MTKAVLYRDEEGLWKGFAVSGHSGYSEAGSDIVCAGISALTITCVNALESVCGIVPLAETNDDGYLEALLPDDVSDDRLHDAQILLSALYQGLKDLAGSYPGYFRLAVHERRNSR